MRVTRHLLLLVAAALALGLAACQPAAPPEPAPPAPPEAPPAAPPPEPAAPPEPAPPEPAPPEPEVDEVADFYEGETVRIIVGFSAGGGYDTYSRLIARHLPDHIPGSPTVIVENMPGAGSLLAANHVFNAAPKDGTVIANFGGGQVLQKFVVDPPEAEFEPGEFQWLPAPTSDTAACAVRVESGFTSLDQAREEELIIGATGPGAVTHMIPSVLRDALDLNLNLIEGYGGTADMRLAADRGETHGGCWAWESISVTWGEELEAGNVLMLGQGGPDIHPDMPDVPHFRDFAETDEGEQLIEAGIVGPGLIIRAYALPPGVPEDRVRAMEEAFEAMYEDSAFLDEAEQAQLAIGPVSVQEFEDTIRDLEALPDDLREQLRAAIEP